MMMNKNTKLSQCGRVLRYMQRYGGISRLRAMNHLGVGNLPARINDLRKILAIETHMVTRNGKRFGVYRIA